MFTDRQTDGQTDRRTDGRTDGRFMIAIAHRFAKKAIPCLSVPPANYDAHRHADQGVGQQH